MITTIDQAGRVVIPKSLREKLHLNRRTEVEILPDQDGLKIRIPQSSAVFGEKAGVLVQMAESTDTLDSTQFINQQREALSLESVRGWRNP